MIEAALWNARASGAQRSFVPAGNTQELKGHYLSAGTLISLFRKHKFFLHPWTLRPYWSAKCPLTQQQQEQNNRKSGAWCVEVIPGMVNGWPAAIKMPVEVMPEHYSVWGNAYGDGSKSLRIGQTSGTVQALLTDHPTPFLRVLDFFDPVLISYANGFAVPGDYPTFFKFLGVQPPEQLDSSLTLFNTILQEDRGSPLPDAFGPLSPTQGQQLLIDLLTGNADIPPVVFQDQKFPYGDRLLRSSDFVLQVDRPATISDFLLDDFGINRLHGFTITPPQRTLYSARVFSIPKYVPPLEPTFEDRLAGTFVEPNWQDIVLGKVWWLSPDPKKLTSDIPDGSWAVYPQSQVFWNLNFASQQLIDPFQADDSLDFFKFIGATLAFGVAGQLIGTMADLIEVEFDTINTALNKTETAGHFWTA